MAASATPMGVRRSRGNAWGAVRHALTVAGLAYIAFVWAGLAPYAPPVPDYGPMFDARGFWIAWDGGLYDIPWGTNEAYVYSPVFAQALWPFTLLPWPLFAALWTLAAVGCLFWMRVPWMIAFPGVVDDILRGNIHVFLAASIVLGMKYPAVIGFGVLTKVTPGIAWLWFAVRREWRHLTTAVVATAIVCAVSISLASTEWAAWFDVLGANASASARIQVVPLPLTIRLAIGALIVAVAARTNRAWLLPIGVMLALPNVWTSSTALLAASASLWLATAGPGSSPSTAGDPILGSQKSGSHGGTK